MRVIVDVELCRGHAQCEDTAPEIFEVGEDALSRLRIQAPPEQMRLKVEEAVRRCPTEAIRIEDD